jgi:hypothetical protein
MPSRFPAKRTTVDGFTFDSKREAKRYGELKMLEKGGEIADLKIHPEFPVDIKGRHFCIYTADFSYNELRRHRDADVAGLFLVTVRAVVEDVKSSGTRKDTAYRLRKKAAELYYGITITETGA